MPERDAKGRFQKGSGGRPRGARNKTTRAVQEILEGDAKAVARSLVRAAKSGDVQAGIAILRLVAPPPRGRLIELDLPQLTKAEDAPKAISAIFGAVAAGTISTAEGHELTGLVGNWCGALRLADIARRLDALEQAQEHEQ